jgi:hypothetical protein
MVILGRSYGNPHKHWRFGAVVGKIARRSGCGASLEKGVRCENPRRSATDETQEDFRMASGLTKTQLVRQMAEKLELTNKQVGGFFDLLTETAVKETKRTACSSSPDSAAW